MPASSLNSELKTGVNLTDNVLPWDPSSKRR
jgi:hypothetical protein